ncbi:hypothetical protein [Natranaerobius trueperi]|uniref:hypothetical protein n=1 Tax=Natranaerobius trueperi TaxID=759412 RepID=UPI001303DB6A|nr:hypothetical protein [Natranaerobius trueperi]
MFLHTYLINLLDSSDKEQVNERLDGLLDAIVPRGGNKLIRSVVENSTVSVLQTGAIST